MLRDKIMSLIEVTKDCYLYHSKNIEMIALVSNIFLDESKNKRYLDFYDLGHIEEIKKRYRFLHEILNELSSNGMSLLELLFNKKGADNKSIDFPIYDFKNLDDFEKYLLDMDAESFFHIFFAENIDKNIIKDALGNINKLSVFYEDKTYISKSFMGLKTFIDNREIFIRDFFSCARSLQGAEFDNAVKYIESIFDDEKLRFEKALRKDLPLEVSQQIMGKTFYNRGPYNKFIFMPSVFSPYKAIRFFYDYQILIYSTEKNEFTNSDAINKLKAISDESRLKILELLKKDGPMIGKDLAKSLKLANSTLSHHIEQLSTAGFLNEERVKNSKYYSINTNSLDGLVDYLSNLFKK
jgi:DNA-binding transcriptional ArsR family regulator